MIVNGMNRRGTKRFGTTVALIWIVPVFTLPSMVVGSVGAVASTSAPIKSITLRTEPIDVKDYEATLHATRQLSGGDSHKAVFFKFLLARTRHVSTTAGSTQTATERHEFISTWSNGSFLTSTVISDPASLLRDGTLRDQAQMGDFGSVDLSFRGTGPVTIRSSCGGRVTTYRRAVKLVGTVTVHPDAPQAPSYFETVTLTALFGRITLRADRSGGHRCKKLPPCPSVSSWHLHFSALDPNDSTSSWGFTALKDAARNPATYSFRAFRSQVSSPVSIIREIEIATTDGSWFAPQSDLTSADMDMGILNLNSEVSGSGTYTYDGTAPSQAIGDCFRPSSSAGYLDQYTHGTFSAPIAVTFDGAGTFESVAGSGSQGSANPYTLESIQGAPKPP